MQGREKMGFPATGHSWKMPPKACMATPPKGIRIVEAAVGNCRLYNGNSTTRNVQMNTQMMRTVVGNGGLYNGNNTSRDAQMNTQMAQVVMGNSVADACQILFLLVLFIKIFPVQGAAPL